MELELLARVLAASRRFLLHNIANIALAGTTAMLLAYGCSQNAVSMFDCSQSWINPTYTTAAVAGLQGVKLVVNILRDGFAGLVQQQPPVRKRRRHGKGLSGATMLDGLMNNASDLTFVNGKRQIPPCGLRIDKRPPHRRHDAEQLCGEGGIDFRDP